VCSIASGGRTAAGAAPRPSVEWLNVFEGLVQETTPASGESIIRLDPRWELDGTHLHPEYVRLLDDGLSQAGAAKTG